MNYLTRYSERLRLAVTHFHSRQPERFWAGVFFVNFFLIIGALYLIKPASRSLVLQYLPATDLPYLWIASACIIFVVVGTLHLAGKRLGGWRFIQVSLLCSIAALAAIRLWSPQLDLVTALSLYVLVDLMGVLLVEQCWSLVNSVFAGGDSRRWYGIIGAGGLIGGMAGGVFAAFLLKVTNLQTVDLPLVTADLLALVVALNAILLAGNVLPQRNRASPELADCTMQLQALPQNAAVQRIRRPMHYLWLMAAALGLSQLIAPLVEIRFMASLVEQVSDLDQRTALLSLFFSLVSAFSVATSIFVVPLLLRHWNELGVMALQPIVLVIVSLAGGAGGGLGAAAVMKFADRGLAYSSTRLARELLFLPLQQNVMFAAKAWIDMFGYRLFKVIGAALVLLLARFGLESTGSAVLVCVAAVLWIAIIGLLRQEQRRDASREYAAGSVFSQSR